jgi:diguanylate cyclase (GGDEF)-like protein/PAS domain S-box-containing protein
MSFAGSGDVFFRLNPQPIYVLDIDTLEITGVNLAAVRHFGYSEEEFLNLSALDMRPPEDRGGFRERIAVETRRLGEDQYVTRHLTKDGRILHVEIACQSFESDGRRLKMAIVNDVSARIEAERRLVRTESRHEKLFDALQEMVFEFEDSGRLITVNSSAEKITGIPREKLLGQIFWDLLVPASRDIVREQWLRDPDRVMELELLTGNRGIIVLEVRCSGHAEIDGRKLFLGIGRDITERTRAERFQRERRKLLGMLSAGAGLAASLALIRDLVDDNLPGGNCFVVAPPVAGREEFISSQCGSATTGEHVRRILEAETGSALPRCLRAVDTRTGIILQEIPPVPGDICPEPAYCWILPVRQPSGESGRIIVLRPKSVAPDRNEAALLEAAGELLQNVIQNERLTAGIRHRARHDALTGLPNSLVFREELERAIGRASTDGSRAAVIFIDINEFKLFNDSAGRVFGDRLLELVARRLQDWLGPAVFVSRMGGDEFTMLIQPAGDQAEVEEAVRRMMRSFDHAFRLDGAEFFITASAGVSIFPQDGHAAVQLLRAADSALHHAKTLGRGAWKFHTQEMDAAVSTRFSIQTQLHRAADRDELSIAYQPQFGLRGLQHDRGKLTGVEALLRWNSPVLGSVPPGTFIPVAEKCGLIGDIGSWVLRRACRQARSWRDSLGSESPRIAVNVSASQFHQEDFLDIVSDAMKTNGIGPDCLELELTESVLMNEISQAQRTIERLRSMGVRIALDDFGTGYSSLSYLERLAVNTLKLDMSFIRRIVPAQPRPALVEGIIRLAHSLEIEVIAEGVETEFQFELLRDLGCDRVQGYLFSKAVSPDSIGELFAGIARPAGRLLRAG